MNIEPRTPHRGRTWRRTTLAAVLLAGTTLGGYAIGHVSLAAETAGAPVNPAGTLATVQTLPDFTHLVIQVKPAVVSIANRLKCVNTISTFCNRFAVNPIFAP
ncbi:MAG: hypothetical protein ABSC95_06920 [Acetobacteraceae bacterium]|jgi:serine protease Do